MTSINTHEMKNYLS